MIWTIRYAREAEHAIDALDPVARRRILIAIGRLAADPRSAGNVKALRFAILTAARSGKVRGATWGQFDMERAIWTMPGARMKAGREHRVPLSYADLAVLRRFHRCARVGRPTRWCSPTRSPASRFRTRASRPFCAGWDAMV